MKYHILTAIAILSVVACAPEEQTIPEDLKGRIALLEQLKTEVDNLETYIQEVQDSVDALSPKVVNKRPVTMVQPELGDFKHYISVQGSIFHGKRGDTNVVWIGQLNHIF
jgi:hypothetical protein